jgi:hypothetical protein
MAIVTLASAPVVTLFFEITSVPSVVILTIMPISFSIAWLKLGKLVKQFYDGRVIPPRNLPEK